MHLTEFGSVNLGTFMRRGELHDMISRTLALTLTDTSTCPSCVIDASQATRYSNVPTLEVVISFS